MAAKSEQFEHRHVPPATSPALDLPSSQEHPASPGQHTPAAGAAPPTAEASPVAATGARPGRVGLGVIVEREPFRADDHVEQFAGERLHCSGDQLARSAGRSPPPPAPHKPGRPVRQTGQSRYRRYGAWWARGLLQAVEGGWSPCAHHD